MEQAEWTMKGLMGHVEELESQLAAMTKKADGFFDALQLAAKINAEGQAREKQLREMWQKVEAEYFSRLGEQDNLTATLEAEKEMYGWNFHKGLSGGLVEFHIYMTKIAKALALPQDDTALRQWGAKLLREMAYIHPTKGNVFGPDELRRKADELEAGK